MFKNLWIAAATLVSLALPLPASAADIKIGVIAPMTGPGAAWGMAEAEGTRFAAEDVNQAGGLDINGTKHKIEVIVYDDQYKASEAMAAYNRLLNQDGAKYILGLTAASVMALKETIESDNVLVLTSTYTRKAIDPNTKHILRLYSTPVDYIPPVVKWMKINLPGKRVAILNPNDETGWDLAKISSEALSKEGYEVIAPELYERSLRDFQPLLTRVIAAKPDIIELGGTPPATAGLIIRQARELGYTKAFAAFGGAGPREVVAAAGAQAAEGMLNVLWADPANEAYTAMVERFRKKIGQPPNELIVSYYDAAKVLLRAISLSGDPTNPEKVREALATKALPMKSLQGQEMTFGGKNTMGVDAQIMTVNYIGQIKNGEPVAVGLAR
jgi:branched-chain amino acid transport system substrate-binding protein